MLRALALLLSLALPAAALAAPLVLPPGVRWMAAAPRADRFTKETGELLTRAGAHAPALGPQRMNLELGRTYGLPLLDETELKGRGVNVAGGWMLFERGGSVYLALAVADGKLFAQGMDQWAASRLLKSRTETALDGRRGVQVLFSRMGGTRAATGYALSGDRAVVLVQSRERTPQLAAALNAVEGAPAVQAPVDGTLVVWMDTGPGLREVWLGLQAKADGVEVTGSARKVDAGVFEHDEGHAAWVRELTASPDGAAGELPLRLRVLAGADSVRQAAASLSDLLAALPTLQDALVQLGPGALEASSALPDLRGYSGQPPSLERQIARILQPQLLFVDRPAPKLSQALKASARALPGARAEGEDLVRATLDPLPITIARVGRTLAVGAGEARVQPQLPAFIPGQPSFSCAKGAPVASLRFDAAGLGNAIKGVGFLTAMRADALIGVYGINTEYGPLLRASRPLLGLACLEPSGKLSIQGRWRILPAPGR